MRVPFFFDGNNRLDPFYGRQHDEGALVSPRFAWRSGSKVNCLARAQWSGAPARDRIKT
jgi:hypothetical protein